MRRPLFGGLLMLLPALAAGPALSFDRPMVFGIGATDPYAAGAGDPVLYALMTRDFIVNAGAVCTRLGINWNEVQPLEGGPYDWSMYDHRVAAAAERGLVVYGGVHNAPSWANGGHFEVNRWPPDAEHMDDWRAFCAAAGARYAGVIDRWQVWNEPNGWGWHEFGRSDEYTALLAASYEALKQGNPACQVAVGGLDDSAANAWVFLEGIYASGGRGFFDAVADHPYAEGNVNVAGLAALRGVMLRHGDGGKPVWITEYGFNASAVGAAAQAAGVQASLDTLCDDALSYVEAATYIVLADFAEPSFGQGWGLVNYDLWTRPAYYTFQSYPKPGPVWQWEVRVSQIDTTSARITWRTNVPARGWVEYGPGLPHGFATALEEAASTVHNRLLTGLAPATSYRFRVRADAGDWGGLTGSDRTFATAPAALANGGFEEGFEAGVGRFWLVWGGDWWRPGSELGVVGSGSDCQAVGTNWGWLDDTLYQRVRAVPGVAYTFSCLTRGDTTNAGGQSLSRRVGIDPAGGIDPDGPGVVWGPESLAEEVWEEQAVSATAAAGWITVFVRARTLLRGEWEWLYVDDASLTSTCASEGLFRTGWNLVSVPLSPLDPGAGAVLDDLLAAGNALEGALFRWEGVYEVYPADFTRVEPGRGFWLRLTRPASEILTGAPLGGPVGIPLQEGWTLVGLPKPAPVALADCLVSDGAGTLPLPDAGAAGWLQPVLYYFDGTYRRVAPSGGDDDRLRPWRGYWLRTNRAGLSLVVP